MGKMFLPFILKSLPVRKLALINFDNDPDEVYRRFELQLIGTREDPRIIAYRSDGYVDVYDHIGSEGDDFRSYGNGLHDRLLVSLSSAHFINGVIKKTNRLSINMVSEAILSQADYVGSVSGSKTDKSEVFDYETGEGGTPMIKDSPLSIECEVEDIYKTEGFESFIVKFSGTYVEESDITDEGKINYRTMKPVLFEFPTYEYLRTGDVIGKCLSLKKGE